MKRTSPWCGLVVVALLLLVLVRELRVEWSINPQYSYGWGVPFLALYLFWKKWQSRPAPGIPSAHPIFFVLVAILALSLLPVRLVQEANPDWRLIAWALALVVVTLTLSGIWFAGGWVWLRHFSFAIVFMLVAVPWPTQFEHGLMQSLMGEVARVTAECMNWIGVAASRRGNLIELPNGTIGVSEACSGMRSFQVALMTSLLLGELHGLSVFRRLALLFGGLAGSVIFNIGRTSLLTWVYARHGPETEASWHDPAGYVTLALVVIAAWGLSAWLRTASPPTAGQALLASSPSPRFLPARVGIALASWIILTEVATECWYRHHEQNAGQGLAWTVVWPKTQSGFQPENLPEYVHRILRCDEGQSGVWRRADGTEWTMFFIQWGPGRMSAQLARGHTPDVCLPAKGFRQIAELGATALRVHNLELPFNTYVFEGRAGLCYVFFCLMDDGGALTAQQAASAAQSYLDGLDRQRRFRAVWEGKRQRGQQVLEIAMTGYATQKEAQSALQSELSALIQLSRSRI